MSWFNYENMSGSKMSGWFVTCKQTLNLWKFYLHVNKTEKKKKKRFLQPELKTRININDCVLLKTQINVAAYVSGKKKGI